LFAFDVLRKEVARELPRLTRFE